MDSGMREYLQRQMPTPVTEWVTNGSMKKEGWTYNAEIQCHLGQFVVAVGLKTREEADKVAKEFTGKLVAQMQQLVARAVMGLPRAKE